VASYGSGKPVIAIVGEFDALPGLSQDAVPTRKILIGWWPRGSGCGHHLFGHRVDRGGDRGEGVAGGERPERHDPVSSAPRDGRGGRRKIYMIRRGLVKDVDAVVSWHPGDLNQVSRRLVARHTQRQVPLPWE
jgi:aminobenzoyl-glutamate utilization protein B